jgi:triosephosphate isomerase
MASRRKFVAGNWKMNGSLAANGELVNGLAAQLAGVDAADVAVCVPAPYFAQVADLLAAWSKGGINIALGAQNASEYASGAYTGEVSCGMLKEFGVRYVIVGHSERRALFGETNAQVAAKYAAVLAAGLTPILCVGETLAEREAGATEAVVAGQLDAVLALGAANGNRALDGGVVAYEPVWAIGTGKTASTEQAQAVHAFIRARVAAKSAAIAAQLRILYGGSVKAGNAQALFACPDIDGGLVGGASLQAQEFAAICKAAA